MSADKKIKSLKNLYLVGGFTLVELLVVISIIAVLLAILMPALSKARAQAKGVVCTSNLKQLGVVTHLYAQGNNNRLMPFQWDNWVIYYWQEALRSQYSNIEKIRFCPSAKVVPNPGDLRFQRSQYGGINNAWRFYQRRKGQTLDADGSYAINGWIIDSKSSDSQLPPFGRYQNPENYWCKIDVKGVSTVPMFFDSMWCYQWPSYDDPWASTPPKANTEVMPIQAVAIPRHGKTISMVCMDGASHRVNIRDVKKFNWHLNYDMGYAIRDSENVPSWMR